jgi:hypothetical protein
MRTDYENLRYVAISGRVFELPLDRISLNTKKYQAKPTLLKVLPRLIEHHAYIRTHPLYYALRCSGLGGVYMYTGGGGYPALGALLDSWMASEELVLYGDSTQPFRKAYIYWGGASRLSGTYVVHAIDADTGTFLRFGYGSSLRLSNSYRNPIDALIQLGGIHPFVLKDEEFLISQLLAKVLESDKEL